MSHRQLILALDFQQRNDIQPSRRYYAVNGVWHVVYIGPSYENHYRLVDLTPEELDYLERNYGDAAPDKRDTEKASE